jgi:hypothetical protein
MRIDSTITIALFAAALSQPALASEKLSAKSTTRKYLHRLTLSDGSWVVINTPFPADEKRKETLPVRVHLYPKDVYLEKETDKCLWVSEHLTSMEYVPSVDHFYALAKETEDHIFIFFTWNAHHCTLDKRTGRILQKGENDEALKAFGSLVPLKLLIWRRARARIHPLNRVDAEDDPFGDL